VPRAKAGSARACGGGSGAVAWVRRAYARGRQAVWGAKEAQARAQVGGRRNGAARGAACRCVLWVGEGGAVVEFRAALFNHVKP